MLRIGEVVDAHADLCEAFFEGEALRGSLPVVAFEEDVKGLLVPCFDLIGGGLDIDFVHIVDMTDDCGTLINGDNGTAPLGLFKNVVVHDTGDKVVAVFLRLAQDFEVPVMEQVIGASGVSNNHKKPSLGVRAYGRRLGHIHTVTARFYTARIAPSVYQPGRRSASVWITAGT